MLSPLLLVFLIKKKKSPFPFVRLGSRNTFLCRTFAQRHRSCAPVDKDCAIGNPDSKVPNSLHHATAEKTFRSCCAFKSCICSRYRIVSVCVFLISTWPKESLYSFVIL